MHILQAGSKIVCSWRQVARCGAQKEVHHNVAQCTVPSETLETGYKWRSSEENHNSSPSLGYQTLVDESLTSDVNRVLSSPLQFNLEDSSPMPDGLRIHAFQRVVCIPFHSSVPTSARAALEQTVRQLVAQLLTRSGPLDLGRLQAHLRQDGLRAVTVYPVKSRLMAGLPFCAPCNSTPFLLVTSGSHDELLVVDASLREHLAVAPSTPAYKRSLAANVPELFIGTRSRLEEVVTSMASAIRLNFASQGMSVPPWRRSAALLGRWSAVAEHELGLLAQRGGQHAALAARQPLHPPAAVTDTCAVVGGGAPGTGAAPQGPCTQAGPDPASVPWHGCTLAPGPALAAGVEKPGEPPQPQQLEGLQLAEGRVHGASVVACSRPVVVVMGFEVDQRVRSRFRRERRGSGGGSPVQPGALASLCRRQQQQQQPGGTSCGSAGSSMQNCSSNGSSAAGGCASGESEGEGEGLWGFTQAAVGGCRL